MNYGRDRSSWARNQSTKHSSFYMSLLSEVLGSTRDKVFYRSPANHGTRAPLHAQRTSASSVYCPSQPESPNRCSPRTLIECGLLTLTAKSEVRVLGIASLRGSRS